MPEQESIIAKFPVDGSITWKDDNGNDVVHPISAPAPPDKILMRDETGRAWAITVGTDGQLQTAKWPDGEPMSVCNRSDLTPDELSKIVAETWKSMGFVPTQDGYERYLLSKASDPG